jgi:hypothetical protein
MNVIDDFDPVAQLLGVPSKNIGSTRSCCAVLGSSPEKLWKVYTGRGVLGVSAHV